jgi:thymidylate synthase
VWGTYFERLIRFGTSGVNQLERAIASAENWERNHQAVLVFHVSSAETDGIRVRGGPCLQYVQLLCPDAKTIELSAVYRSHDYYNKALGNLIGLARLLNFVASEVGRNPGSLTCHSMHAFLGGTKGNVQALIEDDSELSPRS